MSFVTTASVSPIFIASTIWLVLEAPTTQALVFLRTTDHLNVGRDGLFEGDIVLHGNTTQGVNNGAAVQPKPASAALTGVKLWPNGIIPYVVDHQQQSDKSLIRSAMDEIEEKTCLRFVPRASHRNYVRLVSEHGCWSYLGSVGDSQLLSLGPGCLDRMIVLHELMHAAGFIHEHSRSDRDEYIKVFPENAQPGKARNFEKMAPGKNKLLSPFDYDSVMLYGSKTFAREGLYTILTKDNRIIPEVYEKPGLSPRDAQGIRAAYSC